MDMIKKLHRQFILLATLAVFIIIAVALSVINGMMYLIVRGDIHDVLETIADNGGVITTRRISEGGWLPDGSWVEDTPEFTYQTRYFSVLLDSDGTAKVTNINHIAAFSAESAVEAAVAAVKTGESEGYFQKQKGTYAYHVSRTTDGDLLVVILDCTRDLSAVKAFLKYSSLFGLLCLLLFVGIVTVLSGIAIRPFVRNMENQKRFITNASHELKTPLAAIRLLTDSILQTDQMDMETVRDFVTDIGSEAERLSRITEDLLRLTRLDSDLLDAPETVEVAPVLEQVMRMMSLLAQEKGTELTYRMEENCRVSATKGEVHQVIYNLTDNAVKYSGKNGKVRVELRHEDRDVVLTVADNGPGIPEEDLPKVFERFYRVDKARSRAAGGTGLGLSIVQDTVKKRGCTVSAANRAGGGAVFTVRWPEAEGGDRS